MIEHPDNLSVRREEMVQRRRISRNLKNLTFWTMVFALVAGPLVAVFCYKKGNPGLAIMFLSYSLISIPAFGVQKRRVQDHEEEIQQIDSRIELQEFDGSKEEIRAEKLLRINELQLRRYYDLNLKQNSAVFFVGVGCILLGAATIAAASYLVLWVAKDPGVQLLTALLGGAGAILSNFVAAVYLKMHASAADNLAKFHSRLAGMHQLLLGNLLASRIQDDNKRWDTLTSLANHLASPHKQGPESTAG